MLLVLQESVLADQIARHHVRQEGYSLEGHVESLGQKTDALGLSFPRRAFDQDVLIQHNRLDNPADHQFLAQNDLVEFGF